MTAAGPRTVTGIAPLVKSGTLSPSTLVRECLNRIEARSALNAFITVLATQAQADAARAEAEIASGHYRGPLHGIPISVKDLVAVAGTPTTSGSALPPLHPAGDAPVIGRLREAGAIVIGKTNLHEFAFGTTSDETAFGAVRHPLDETRSPGGSSGGSAVALVEGMCFGSVGTDTGGSIRIPSAACGTVGLKATFGELPCDGVVPLSTTLDHVGPMARSVGDVGLLFQAMKGRPVHPIAPAGGRLVFGVPRDYFFDPIDEGVVRLFRGALSSLVAGGHSVIDVTIPHASWTPGAYLHISLPEAAWYHAPTIVEHAAKYSPGVRLRIEMGRYVLAEDYVRAMHQREQLTAEVDEALERCDALVLPALPIPAPPVGASSVDVGGTRQPVRAMMLKLTQLFNLTGHPAIALPAGIAGDGLPRGLQLVGPRGRTERLLDVAAAVELQIAAGPGSVGGGTG